MASARVELSSTRETASRALRMVSRMVEAGLLNRSPDICDGRRSWVTLSSRSLDTVRRLLETEPGSPVPARL